MALKSYQRINHFPGMVEICRKDYLAKNFMRLSRMEPSEYDFMPKTWVIPQEHGFLLNYAKRAASRGTRPTFIMKPANGAMGHGIRLFRSGENVPSNPINGTPCVVQEYIPNPLLIDGYKCDLRVYVLVTSCDPLRIFIYSDGLVRLGTEKYMEPTEPNGESLFMHLTNYALNKHNAGYNNHPDETRGSKRSFSFLEHHLRNTLNVDPNIVWRSIRELIVKTLVLSAPHLLHAYRTCRHRGNMGRRYSWRPTDRFTATSSSATTRQMPTTPLTRGKSTTLKHPGTNQTASSMASTMERLSLARTRFCQSSFFEILGFDILLDADLKPWLIEVNRSPSLNGDQELDRRVKHGLLRDALRLLNIRPTDKKSMEDEQRVDTCRRLYHSANATSNLMRTRSSSTGEGTLDSKWKRKSVKRSPAVQQYIPGATVDQTASVDREIYKLHQQLVQIRRRSELEFYEYHNCGNWRLIFPTDNHTQQQCYVALLLRNFSTFHLGKGGDLQKELEETYQHPVTEDDILDRLNELTNRDTVKNFLNEPDQKSMNLDFELDYPLDEYHTTSSDESSAGGGAGIDWGMKDRAKSCIDGLSRTDATNPIDATKTTGATAEPFSLTSSSEEVAATSPGGSSLSNLWIHSSLKHLTKYQDHSHFPASSTPQTNAKSVGPACGLELHFDYMGLRQTDHLVLNNNRSTTILTSNIKLSGENVGVMGGQWEREEDA